jgi:hypothetical protein
MYDALLQYAMTLCAEAPDEVGAIKLKRAESEIASLQRQLGEPEFSSCNKRLPLPNDLLLRNLVGPRL